MRGIRHPGQSYQIGHIAVKDAVPDRPIRSCRRLQSRHQDCKKTCALRLQQEILSLRLKSVDILRQWRYCVLIMALVALFIIFCGWSLMVSGSTYVPYRYHFFACLRPFSIRMRVVPEV
jgi:hypothetical protein